MTLETVYSGPQPLRRAEEKAARCGPARRTEESRVRKIDFMQPSQAPLIPLWAAAWYRSRIALYRLLPLKGAMMLSTVSCRIDLLARPARRRKIEALLKPLLPEGTSPRDLRRYTVLSRMVRRMVLAPTPRCFAAQYRGSSARFGPRDWRSWSRSSGTAGGPSSWPPMPGMSGGGAPFSPDWVPDAHDPASRWCP